MFGLKTSWYTVGDDESNITVAIYVLDKKLALPVELQLTSVDISASMLIQISRLPRFSNLHTCREYISVLHDCMWD